MLPNFKRDSRRESHLKPNTRLLLIILWPSIKKTRILPIALIFLTWEVTIRRWWINTMNMRIEWICQLKKELSMMLKWTAIFKAFILKMTCPLCNLPSKPKLPELRENLSIVCWLVPTKENNPIFRPFWTSTSKIYPTPETLINTSQVNYLPMSSCYPKKLMLNPNMVKLWPEKVWTPSLEQHSKLKLIPAQTIFSNLRRKSTDLTRHPLSYSSNWRMLKSKFKLIRTRF